MARRKSLPAEQSWPKLALSKGKFPEDYSSKILNTIWQLKKEGYADSTLKAYDSRLRMLAT